MNRRAFFRRAALGAAAIAVTPSILERIGEWWRRNRFAGIKLRKVQGDVYWSGDVERDLRMSIAPIARAIDWLGAHGWALERVPDRAGYMASKRWMLGDAAEIPYTCTFFLNTFPSAQNHRGDNLLRQAQYQAHKAEADIEHVREVRRQHGFWMRISRKIPPDYMYGVPA